ncbi:P-loop NTPase [Actinomadura formosensis]|uniref:P-loop NTPase n=1 Tax=Actinomadura formosensis TaxID=60706 RepID=UPI00082F98C5|nr:hypothetical protein [Actinomadura formosensis]
MDASIQSLLARLMTGPAMLLLGQRSGSHEQPEIPVPDPLSSRRDLETAFLAVDQRVQSERVPEWLVESADYPWNGIFTSRIDRAVQKVFTRSWRRVVPTTVAQLGRNPRSATELQLRFLFGGLGLPDDERPPLDVIEEAEARSKAMETLRTVADSLITPRGVLVIEGYGTGDWLSTRELFAFLGRLQPGQAHLFSASPEVLEDPFVTAALGRGTLIAHTGTFAAALKELEESGRFQRESAGRGGAARRLIAVEDGFAEIDVSTWNRVIGAARPVDVELLTPFAKASQAVTYQRFRTFLGASEGAPPWRAIASGFSFARDFQADLLEKVQTALAELVAQEPLVVAGQTATGKSIALCDLALRVARSGKAAVLHRSRRGDRPSLAEIEAFATWADENHGLPTLFVWDGMVETDEYYTLQRQLRSRGQRVLIVGSTYYIRERTSGIIRVEAALSPRELREIRRWLLEYGVHVPSDLGTSLDSSFLALLYRVLPETERSLRRGLALEMRTAENRLEKLARMRPSEDPGTRLTSVAQALKDAGFEFDTVAPSDRPHAELKTLSFEERSSTERFTSITLVAGRRGLLIPLELVLRVLGAAGMGRVVELVKDFDIFRWEADEAGNEVIGARTQLEAELMAREDLSVGAEVETASQMILNLRPSPTRSGGPEVQFAVDLMETMGPQSRGTSRYSQHYLNLATSFRDLRESMSWTHHRLVLLEVNLTREHVLKVQKNGRSGGPERIALLQEMQHLLEDTLEEADIAPRSRLNLLVELASTMGAQVFELAGMKEDLDADTIVSLMEEVTRAVLAARALDPESVYPVDVVAWATPKALSTQLLPDTVKVDLLANMQASLDSIDADSLSPNQRAKYSLRQTEMARLLGNPALEARHLQALMDNEDPAAYYFLARKAAEEGDEGKRVAIDSLKQAPKEVRADWRCSRLLLNLFWQLKTGKDFLRGEREVLAFGLEDWNECLAIADVVPTSADFDRYRLDFLRGLSLFHLGSFKASDAVFQQLDRESQDLSSRVVATYLASTPEGKAAVYTGRVTWATPDGRRGKAWVDQLSTEVAFIPQRFSVTDFRRKNDVLPSFHIAFNMRGALADPIRKIRRSER